MYGVYLGVSWQVFCIIILVVFSVLVLPVWENVLNLERGKKNTDISFLASSDPDHL